MINPAIIAATRTSATGEASARHRQRGNDGKQGGRGEERRLEPFDGGILAREPISEIPVDYKNDGQDDQNDHVDDNGRANRATSHQPLV